MENLKKELDEALGGFKSALADQAKQIAEYGETKAATAKHIDELGKTIEALQTEVTGIQSNYDKLTAKKNRIGGGAPEQKSPGLATIESEVFEEFMKKGLKDSGPIECPSFHTKSGILTSDPASGGAWIDPFRDPNLIIPAERTLRLRDLMAVSPLSTGGYEYAEETGYANLCTALTTGYAAGVTTINVENPHGILFSAAGVPAQIGNDANREDILVTAVDTATGDVTLAAPTVNAHNANDPFWAAVFGCTPETQIKPQAQIDFALRTLSVCTVAHWIPIARQLLDDNAAVQGTIDQRLIYGLKLAEEHQMLYGDGQGNLQGILKHSGINQYAWNSGPSTDTKLDAIRRGMTLSRLAEYPTTGTVINPLDWEDIELAKGSDNHYIWTTAPGSGAQMQVWRVPVVETTAIEAGTILTGAFGLGAKIWDREDANVRFAEQHDNFFVRNMVAMLAEERLLQAIYRPEAFTAIDVTTAP